MPDIYCPQCMDEGRYEPLNYDRQKGAFEHANGNYNCYHDGRCNDRHHPLIQQEIFARWTNSSEHENAEIEYSLDDNSFDVGAETPGHESLTGVLAEVQHRTGSFYTRIERKIRVAHSNNYGVYVVVSPEAVARDWFQQQLKSALGDQTAVVGKYHNGRVQMGELIMPGKTDRTALGSRIPA